VGEVEGGELKRCAWVRGKRHTEQTLRGKKSKNATGVGKLNTTVLTPKTLRASRSLCPWRKSVWNKNSIHKQKKGGEEVMKGDSHGVQKR